MDRLYIVTGAAGHLAGTIIKYLKKEDCIIRGLILPSENAADEKNVKYFKGDITKEESLREIFDDTDGYEVFVIHAAGIVSITRGAFQLLHDVNVNGTKNMIHSCMKHNVKRMLYVSSVHAIPATNDMSTIAEVDSFSINKVHGDYARTKAEATQTVMDAVRNGLDAVIVHPSGILGPYDEGNNHMIQLIKLYISGKLPAGVRGGYDFVDVRDVAKGCISAIDKGEKGECYILSNRFFTIKELLDYMRIVVNGKKKICLPLPLAKSSAAFFEWLSKLTRTRALFTRYSLAVLDSNGHFSHDKATMFLGYSPRDMKTTIADTISWLKNKKCFLKEGKEENDDEMER